MENKKFEEWAVIELFGHQRICGRVSEQQVGGCAFVRVDVPAHEGKPAFTKLLGNGSIYAITISDEPTVRALSAHYRPEPMDKWTIKDMLAERALPAHAGVDEEDTTG